MSNPHAAPRLKQKIATLRRGGGVAIGFCCIVSAESAHARTMRNVLISESGIWRLKDFALLPCVMLFPARLDEDFDTRLGRRSHVGWQACGAWQVRYHLRRCSDRRMDLDLNHQRINSIQHFVLTWLARLSTVFNPCSHVWESISCLLGPWLRLCKFIITHGWSGR